jgi:protein-tyrosine phosphatase
LPNVFWLPSFASGSIGIALRPRGGDWLHDDVARLRAEGVDLLVSLLTTKEQVELGLLAEAECCITVGMEYVSAPMPDLGAPDDAADFRKFIRRLASDVRGGKSVAIHCRQSVGRSGLVTCSVLLALGLSLSHAVTCVSAARGVEVPETQVQREWLRQNEHQLARLAGYDSS